MFIEILMQAAPLVGGPLGGIVGGVMGVTSLLCSTSTRSYGYSKHSKTHQESKTNVKNYKTKSLYSKLRE